MKKNLAYFVNPEAIEARYPEIKLDKENTAIIPDPTVRYIDYIDLDGDKPIDYSIIACHPMFSNTVCNRCFELSYNALWNKYFDSIDETKVEQDLRHGRI